MKYKIDLHKEQSFARNYLIFLKILCQYKNFLQELIWCTNKSNVHIHTFRKSWSAFSLWVSLKELVAIFVGKLRRMFKIQNSNVSFWIFIKYE